MTTNSTKFDFIFEYPVLTKAQGPLDYPVLKIIQDELKTNAACIDLDLGGGANGHLGILLTTVQYEKVAPGTPYIRHVMPVTLVLATNTPQHEVTRRRDDYKEDKRLFKGNGCPRKITVKTVKPGDSSNVFKGLQKQTQ